MSKNLIFITPAPMGTLGDPSGAVSMIQNLKKERVTKDVSARLFVYSPIEYHDRIRGIIPNDIESSVLSYAEFLKQLTINNEVKSYFADCDAIVLYPVPHMIKYDIYQKLQEFKKPVFCITHYNIDAFSARAQISREYVTDDNELHFPGYTSQIATGFANTVENELHKKTHIGIHVTEEVIEKSHYKIADINADNLKNFLLDNGDDEAYFTNHDLFMGYYNNIPETMSSSGLSPLNFIQTCVEKSKQNGKHIDIILPLKKENALTTKDEVMTELTKIYGENKYQFAYYCKDINGTYQQEDIIGKGPKLIRLIDAFPLDAATMDILFKVSDDLCMVTGNASFSEALSNIKLPLYQTTNWSTVFFKSMVNSVKLHVGEYSELYRFFQLQESRDPYQIQEMTDLLSKHGEELKAQMTQWREKIFKEENLASNLSKLLIQQIENPESYLTNCSNEFYAQQSTRDILHLSNMFPDDYQKITSQINKVKKVVSWDFFRNLLQFTNDENVIRHLLTLPGGGSSNLTLFVALELAKEIDDSRLKQDILREYFHQNGLTRVETCEFIHGFHRRNLWGVLDETLTREMSEYLMKYTDFYPFDEKSIRHFISIENSCPQAIKEAFYKKWVKSLVSDKDFRLFQEYCGDEYKNPLINQLTDDFEKSYGTIDISTCMSLYRNLNTRLDKSVLVDHIMSRLKSYFSDSMINSNKLRDFSKEAKVLDYNMDDLLFLSKYPNNPDKLYCLKSLFLVEGQYDWWSFFKGEANRCALYVMRNYPETPQLYKKSYICAKRELYYITPEGRVDKVKLVDFVSFEKNIESIAVDPWFQNELGLNLRKDQIEQFVTSAGGQFDEIPDFPSKFEEMLQCFESDEDKANMIDFLLGQKDNVHIKDILDEMFSSPCKKAYHMLGKYLLSVQSEAHKQKIFAYIKGNFSIDTYKNVFSTYYQDKLEELEKKPLTPISFFANSNGQTDEGNNLSAAAGDDLSGSVAKTNSSL